MPTLAELRKYHPCDEEKSSFENLINISSDGLKEKITRNPHNLTLHLVLLNRFLSSPNITNLPENSFIFYQDFQNFCRANGFQLKHVNCFDMWKNESQNFMLEINSARTAIGRYKIYHYDNEDNYLKIIFKSINPEVSDLYFKEIFLNDFLHYYKENPATRLVLQDAIAAIPATVRTIHLELSSTCKRKISPKDFIQYLSQESIDLYSIGSQDIQLTDWNFPSPRFSRHLSLLASSNSDARRDEQPIAQRPRNN